MPMHLQNQPFKALLPYVMWQIPQFYLRFGSIRYGFKIIEEKVSSVGKFGNYAIPWIITGTCHLC